MQKDALLAILNDQKLWETLESFILGDGSVLPTSRIEGFVRKKKYIPLDNYYQNLVKDTNFYFTNDENQGEKISKGTLEYDDAHGMIKFVDSTQGDTVWTDIDTICTVKFKPVEHKYYPGQTLG